MFLTSIYIMQPNFILTYFVIDQMHQQLVTVVWQNFPNLKTQFKLPDVN